jgi:hypothetical protein
MTTVPLTNRLTICLILGLLLGPDARAERTPGADEETPAVLRSARSGPWSAPTTWEGGKVPGGGSRVLIRAGHRVVFDVLTEDALRAINVAGTLTFATDRDTRLDVGLIKIQAGEQYSEAGFDCEAHLTAPDADQERAALEVGTPDHCVDARHTATIRLVYFAGMDKLSCPAIVCCGGRMDFHGAPLSRTWLKLGTPAKKGDVTVTLADKVTGWRVGDQIVVTGTLNPDHGRGWQTEERTVRAIQDTTLTLDRPLQFDHAGSGEFRAEVANLSRNVVVESADPTGFRGHTMVHRYSAGSISYAEFRHLGKEGVLGRYSLHYHLVGDTMRGSSVIGASIWDSDNRWLTIHGTNYLVVRDCVGYKSVGHGFFFEDGTEVHNVLDHNLAVQARRGKPLPKQVLPFDQNEGAGFWWANSLNTFTRNVACENARYGYRFEATRGSNFSAYLLIQQPDGSQKGTDIRTLPFVRFDDNEAHSDGLYGFNLGEGVARVGPDTRHPFVIRRMKIWEIHYAIRPQSPSVLVEDLLIDRAVYGVYHPNYDHHVYRNVTINGDGDEPFNRGHDDDSVQYGPLTVDGLRFTATRGSRTSIPLIQLSDDNPTGQAVSHFRNVEVLRQQPGDRRPVVDTGGGAHVTPKTPQGVPVVLHDYFGPDRHAKISATNARDFGADGLMYRDEAPLTGHEARVAEVRNVVFPRLLDPIADLPPTTVVTHIHVEGRKIVVRGTTASNNLVRRVLVNGQAAHAVRSNFAEWELVLEGAGKEPLKVESWAEDEAGNVEPRPHVVRVPR